MHPCGGSSTPGTAAVAIALPVALGAVLSSGLDRLVRDPDARSLDHSRARLADRIWRCRVVRVVDSPAGRICSRSGPVSGPCTLPAHSSARRCAFRSRASRRRSFRLPPAVRSSAALAYSISIWCWSLAILGIATRFLSHANAPCGYVADASYWIYLMHLPVVVALQVLVGKLPWHWSIKFPLILVVSLTVLFASYRYLVRSTFIGELLNGRRYPEVHPACATRRTTEILHPSRRGHAGETPLAALTGLHKRYGKTVALAGLDLEIRSGELLAVLGPNGAGKSTAISLWLGLIEPDAGAVQLLGGSPLDVDSRRHVGVMMQEVGIDTGAARPRADRSHRELLSQSPHDRAGARADAHRAAGRPALREALRRPEAAGAVRARDLRPPAAALPRRADRRSRHRGSRSDVANDPTMIAEGLLDRSDDALPRRGRGAGRSRRGARRGRLIACGTVDQIDPSSPASGSPAPRAHRRPGSRLAERRRRPR